MGRGEGRCMEVSRVIVLFWYPASILSFIGMICMKVLELRDMLCIQCSGDQ